MKIIDITFRTMFAELVDRSLDAAFETDFPVDGRFVSVPVKGRNYWYFDRRDGERTIRRYVGPESDEGITRRVKAFGAIKGDLKARRKLVSTLTREAGLPAPETFTGDVIAALAEAGLFRLRGVLVGTVAFQCYAGLLGIRLPGAVIQTGDADFAQFHSIAAAVGDSLPPILDILKRVDPTFRDVPHTTGGLKSSQFENAGRYRVEFLTPNRGSDDLEGQPAPMPTLGGASAEPLRFLDFLIYQPVRSVLLHASGIGVTVPAPERYAVHKLIVASRRRTAGNVAKRDKDAMQAGLLIEALAATRRHADLAIAVVEAWGRGPSWRKAVSLGAAMLPEAQMAAFRQTLADGCRAIGEEPPSLSAD